MLPANHSTEKICQRDVSCLPKYRSSGKAKLNSVDLPSNLIALIVH